MQRLTRVAAFAVVVFMVGCTTPSPTVPTPTPPDDLRDPPDQDAHLLPDPGEMSVFFV